jgi:hypothetical protein
MLSPKVKPLSAIEIERIAHNKLGQLFPDSLRTPQAIDVLETWELLKDLDGFDIRVVDLPDGIEGRTWPDRRVELSTRTYIGLCQGEHRPRFTTIHECWHAWQHSKQIRQMIESTNCLVLNRRSEIPAYLNPEWQANSLAAAFLMPAAAILVLRRTHKLTVSLLVETFNVSPKAASVRLEVLTKLKML